MNVSYLWLKALAPGISDTPEEIARRLGMLGAPVDDMTDIGADLGDLVIGKVVDVQPHPNADRLRICTVQSGAAEPVQVVCGAPNVEAGGLYPFAPIGARLPGGIEIRKAKLRGERSEGMLCSARELGLGKDHTGLMTLHGDLTPGASFLDATGLADWRLELDITPNRSDLLSHLGVARELATGGAAEVSLPAFPDAPPSRPLEVVSGQGQVTLPAIRVTIDHAEDCPRYVAAVLENVEVRPSPEWLAGRLRAIGVRPINNVVDATNYVLHELGQPLHAFDLDKLAGPEIHVRRARAGEMLRTLDGVERALSEEAIVIADRDRPVALAGIMGGEESEVGPTTTRLLLECALFDPRRVRSTAKKAGLSTDASHRYERGVDPTLQLQATGRVIELIRAIAGGDVVGSIADNQPEPLAERVVDLRLGRIERVLGVQVEADEVRALLSPIGFQVEGSEERLTVRIPGFRPDVSREIDVIEEVARRRGYDSFDSGIRPYRPGRVPADPLVSIRQGIADIFNGWGFLEARTAAFAPARPDRVPILNPLSAEESHLRDDLAHGLLRRAEYNWARGVRSIRLYEFGTVFSASKSDLEGEEFRVAAIFSGPDAPLHWSAQSKPYDFWDLKGLAEVIATQVGASLALQADAHPIEPIASGEGLLLVKQDGQVIGWAGRVAAEHLDAPAWAEDLWLLELSLADVPATAADRLFSPLPAFPSVERDLALVLEPGISAADVERIVRDRGGPLLEDLRAFDLYEGKGIPEGTRSVAWRLRFRHAERTLTDAEVDAVTGDILQALHKELNVERR